MKNEEKNLRIAIRINAVFSMLSGLTLIIWRNSIADIMDIEGSKILVFIGVGLLLFGTSLIYDSSRKNLVLKKIRLIIISDWVWVAGSVMLLVLDPFGISQIGNLLIGIVAFIVMSFAIVQSKVFGKLK